METIKNYLENMFAAFPKTEAVLKLKEEMLSNMEDKYNELKSSGRSENEAIGIVISEFGNIEELVKELNLPAQADSPLGVSVSREYAEQILRDKIRYSKWISLGVFLCLLGPALLVVMSGILNNGRNFSDESFIVIQGDMTPFSLLPLFLCIAVAVILFIVSGMQLNQYEFLEKEPIIIDYSLKTLLMEKKSAFQTFYTTLIATGVALCILSPLILILFVAISNIPLSGNFGVFLLLVIIGVAIAMFIRAGSEMETYKQLLQIEEYSPVYKKENQIIGIIAPIFWPLVTASYLIWSFTTGDWHKTWIVWPIAGISFGVLSAILSSVLKLRQNN